MREAIGGSKLYLIGITLILLFSGYLAFSINRSRVYKIKNDIVNIIERNNGISENARMEINAYLANSGYHSTGDCGNDYMAFNTNSTSISSNGGMYCIKRTQVTNSEIDKVYYNVAVFFRLDIPIIDTIFNYKVTGQTKSLFRPTEF